MEYWLELMIIQIVKQTCFLPLAMKINYTKTWWHLVQNDKNSVKTIRIQIFCINNKEVMFKHIFQPKA